MNYRLIAFDLDGTLLDSQLYIRPSSIEAIYRARKRDVQCILITGRHHSAAYAYWKQLDLKLPVVCCNGAYAYDFVHNKPLVDSNPLSHDEAKALLHIVRKHRIFTMIYDEHAMVYEKGSTRLSYLTPWANKLAPLLRPRIEAVADFAPYIDTVQNIWKFTVADDDSMAMHALAQNIETTLGLRCEWSGDNRIDIIRPTNSKGRYLAKLLDVLAISPDEVIAFGDQQNDLEMLQMSGLAIAMGNAIDEVKACADWVTGDNNSDGIAETLQRFDLI